MTPWFHKREWYHCNRWNNSGLKTEIAEETEEIDLVYKQNSYGNDTAVTGNNSVCDTVWESYGLVLQQQVNEQKLISFETRDQEQANFVITVADNRAQWLWNSGREAEQSWQWSWYFGQTNNSACQTKDLLKGHLRLCYYRKQLVWFSHVMVYVLNATISVNESVSVVVLCVPECAFLAHRIICRVELDWMRPASGP